MQSGEAKVALAKRAPVERNKVRGTPSPSTVQAKWAEPSTEQGKLGSGWNHVRGGRVVRATTPPAPTPTPGRVTENPPRNEVTTTRKTGKTAKSAPKVTVGPKQALVAKSNKPAKSKQPSQLKELVSPSDPTSHPLGKSPIFSTTFCYTHVWSSLSGSSHPSHPSLLGQLACGLCSKS